MTVHDPSNQRFYIPIESISEPAELRYTVQDGIIHFYRTYVPEQARGGQLAYTLVKEGIEWAEKEGLAIIASCWYVEKFLNKRGG